MKAWDGLKPQNVVQAARADIERRKRNEKMAAGAVRNDDYEQYAFCRNHVMRADGAFGLIEIALKDLRSIVRFKSKWRIIAMDGPNEIGVWTEHALVKKLRTSTKKHLKNLYEERLLEAALELEKKNGTR